MAGNMHKLVNDMKDASVIDLLDRDILDNYQGKWQELWFFKDGTTILETDIWNTKKEAQRHIDYLTSPQSKMLALQFNNGFKCFCFHVSHAMPMPVQG